MKTVNWIIWTVVFALLLGVWLSGYSLFSLRDKSPYAKGDLSFDGAIYVPEADLDLYVIRKVKTNEQFMIVKTKAGAIEVIKY